MTKWSLMPESLDRAVVMNNSPVHLKGIIFLPVHIRESCFSCWDSVLGIEAFYISENSKLLPFQERCLKIFIWHELSLSASVCFMGWCRDLRVQSGGWEQLPNSLSLLQPPRQLQESGRPAAGAGRHTRWKTHAHRHKPFLWCYRPLVVPVVHYSYLIDLLKRICL